MAAGQQQFVQQPGHHQQQQQGAPEQQQHTTEPYTAGQYHGVTFRDPLPDAKMLPPLRAPGPGEVIVAYEPVAPDTGCCKCQNLSPEGLIAVVILAFVFPCAACVPCCNANCFDKMQRPIYGRQGQGQGQGQGQVPAQGYPQQSQYGGYPNQVGGPVQGVPAQGHPYPKAV